MPPLMIFALFLFGTMLTVAGLLGIYVTVRLYWAVKDLYHGDDDV